LKQTCSCLRCRCRQLALHMAALLLVNCCASPTSPMHRKLDATVSFAGWHCRMCQHPACPMQSSRQCMVSGTCGHASSTGCPRQPVRWRHNALPAPLTQSWSRIAGTAPAGRTCTEQRGVPSAAVPGAVSRRCGRSCPAQRSRRRACWAGSRPPPPRSCCPSRSRCWTRCSGTTRCASPGRARRRTAAPARRPTAGPTPAAACARRAAARRETLRRPAAAARRAAAAARGRAPRTAAARRPRSSAARRTRAGTHSPWPGRCGPARMLSQALR